MRKTLHRIGERGVFEIPDYDYIKSNAAVDLNRCDSILLTGTRSGVEEPSEEIKRPQSGVLDIETSKKLDNPTYVDIPTESGSVKVIRYITDSNGNKITDEKGNFITQTIYL